MDPRLEGKFDAGLAWKITEVAMACASQSSVNRPTMSQVVAELKESVNRARAGGGGSNDISPEDSTIMVSMDFDSRIVPQPR